MYYHTESLNQSRKQGDPLADQVIAEMIADQKIKEYFSSLRTNADLNHCPSNDSVQALISNVLRPSSYRRQIIHLGQKVFEEQMLPIMSLLGLYALPYCYAAANGARVLIHSKNIITNPSQRLGETAQFVVNTCMPGSFEEQGMGYVSIIKVRLMHAAIRHYAAKHIVEEVPINQEDMAGTNLSFSLICLRGLQKLYVSLEEKKSDAYLKLWNDIGSRLGIQAELLPENLKEANQLEKAIRKHQFRASAEGKRLIEALTAYFEQSPINIPGWDAQLAMRSLMGQEVADILGLKKSRSGEDIALSVVRTSQFFLSFVQDNYKEIYRQLNKKSGYIPKQELFHIPV